MKNRNISIVSLFFLLLTASCAWCEDADLARLFSGKKVEGTIVISSLDGTQRYIHNDRRAETPLLPASTFKIPNTLIALQEGVIGDREVVKWDGVDRGVTAWNRDQTLESAFKSTCIWFYQELARRIGAEKYKTYLNKISYGNAIPGPELTTFWLEGDLRISAFEQIDFLKKVYHRKLPFRPAAYNSLGRLMIIETTPAYTLRAKTGWVGWDQRITPQIGWYVGYVEAKGTVWFFATNITIKKPDDAKLRQQITMEALKLKRIL